MTIPTPQCVIVPTTAAIYTIGMTYVVTAALVGTARVLLCAPPAALAVADAIVAAADIAIVVMPSWHWSAP